jgi:hypothetical protein
VRPSFASLKTRSADLQATRDAQHSSALAKRGRRTYCLSATHGRVFFDTNERRGGIFDKIVSHEGPLGPSHPNYKGSAYNVCLTGPMGSAPTNRSTSSPSTTPSACADYAREHNLLDTGWIRFRKLAKRSRCSFDSPNSLSSFAPLRLPVVSGSETTEAVKINKDNRNNRVAFRESSRSLSSTNTLLAAMARQTNRPGFQGHQDALRLLRTSNTTAATNRVCCRRSPPRYLGPSVYSGVVSLRSVHMITLRRQA